MVQLVALQGNNAMPNALGAFAEGQKQAAGIDMAKKESAQKSMELIGSIALGAMGGKMDGEVNPQIYEQGLDILQGYGVDVSGFRGKPQLAPVAARASLSALQQLQLANDDRTFNLAMEKFDRDMMEADRSYGLQRETLDFNKQKATAGDVPSGYQRTANGLEAIPGGPADPENPMNTRKVTGPNLSVTVQKEIIEADEGIQAGKAVVQALDRALELNEQAYSGPAAETRGYAGSLIGMDSAVATEELKNLVTAQALDQLRATFGAMPTEGERKILIEIQGSVNQAPEVRKRIYERAKAAAQRRIAFAEQKAQTLRSGEYFSEGPGSPAPTLEMGTDQSEVTTQEAYDALPSGAEFMSGGKRYRKP